MSRNTKKEENHAPTDKKNITDKKGLFIFRRDLRVTDNTGLYDLAKTCSTVSCIFVLDPEQINPAKNKYFSMNAVLFMIDCLMELKKNIKVSIVTGKVTDVIETLLKKHDFDVVGFNEDYTPYARQRDTAIERLLHRYKKECFKYADVCLNAPTAIKPYKVFTPYYDFASSIKVAKPVKKKLTNIVKLNEKEVDLEKFRKTISKICTDNGVNVDAVQRGGRTAAIQCIKKFKCSSYGTDRDSFTGETSRLGPHLKFGTVSPREIYYACTNGVFRKQLYWRDFYLQIAWHFPYVFGSNFRHTIKWENNVTYFKKWCAGETGYPIVDACMKQMNETGYMPNRGRMIVASFLTKILHIDWRWGEKYFASRLTDYDPANNNGGWQWSAGTGVDAQPYFRIFNPTTQADEHDPKMIYRDRWLGNDWRDDSVPYSAKHNKSKPIVDYSKERTRALKLIKA